MSGARNLFGLTFGIGVRNRPPNKGEAPVTLHHGDVVNLVDVGSNQYDAEPFLRADRKNEFVTAQGVDFIHDNFSRSLKIRVRYSKVDANRAIVLETLNLTHAIPHQPVQDNDISRWVSHIIPGTYFATRDGEMASVVRVQGNQVLALLESNDNEAIFHLNEAAALLRSYIG